MKGFNDIKCVYLYVHTNNKRIIIRNVLQKYCILMNKCINNIIHEYVFFRIDLSFIFQVRLQLYDCLIFIRKSLNTQTTSNSFEFNLYHLHFRCIPITGISQKSFAKCKNTYTKYQYREVSLTTMKYLEAILLYCLEQLRANCSIGWNAKVVCAFSFQYFKIILISSQQRHKHDSTSQIIISYFKMVRH